MQGTGGFLQPEEIVKQLNIRKDMQVADFGCGAGYFTITLAKLTEQGKIYALDVMEQALESVRSRAKMQGLFNIETKRCNLEVARSSGLADNSIDLALLANILFQSTKKVDIMKEARRILKKGGEIVIIDWLPNQPMGPPRDLIVSPEAVKKMAQDERLVFKKDFPVDAYHWGMIFTK